MTQVPFWFLATRPKTLIASIVPVLIGSTIAFSHQTINGNIWLLPLILFSAICIQITTNLVNDLRDFEKGADTADRVGPTRVVVSGLITPEKMKAGILVSSLGAILSGLMLVWEGGLPILLIGLFSMIFAFLYTAGPKPIAYTPTGEFFVVLFFGIIATGGTYYLFTKTIQIDVLIAGLAPGFLAATILLANNMRDIETDRECQKMTLAVYTGRQSSARIIFALLLLTAFIPITLTAQYQYSSYIFLAYGFLIPAITVLSKAFTAQTPEDCIPLLSGTALTLSVYGILFCCGVLL